jgi:type II secretory ATPase GspE/PulE/Tfp pilus assembly ATPase PilB-like protein
MNAKIPVLPHQDVFKWPAPPYFEFLPDPERPVHEPCLVVLAGGHKLQGELLEFIPDAAILELRIASDSAGPLPAYADMTQLRLLRPMRLLRQALPRELADAEIVPASEWQTYTIETHDGAILTGETHGYIRAQCGVFLFLREGIDQITRSFTPEREIKAFHIGPPIGRMLIDENKVPKAAVDAALARQRELRVQKLGEVLTDNQIVSVDELAVALKHQQQRPILKLGKVLTDLELITESELVDALALQQRNRKVPLGQILIDMGVVDQEVVKTVMAKKLGIPFVNLRKFHIAAETIQKIPATLVHRHTVLPVFQTDTSLVVAIENPLATAILEELRFASGMNILPVMATHDDIRAAIHKHCGYSADSPSGAPELLAFESSKDDLAFYSSAAGDSKIDTLATQLASEGGELEIADEQVVETDTTLVKLINKMIMDAHLQKASDIHIETYPGVKNTRVRFRKDGALLKYLELPSKFRSALVSRIKIMATLDISERRKPQDGKIDFSRFGPARLELRVATIPTNNGIEDVVMRLLAGAKPLPIAQLGFSDKVLRDVQQVMAKPHGLCLVCGPTGSGKTTTLHSLLGYINTEDRKIWTAEDPIEITQEGLRQVQINAKIGWTFAAAMRAFLRADPDVIMVGEMRDAETTKTGIEASLTGHLVLSTLHTNSAPESVVRLLDMGMDPFNFADALLCILAQRLARRLCPACKKSCAPAAGEIEELLKEYCLEGGLDAAKELTSWRGRYGDGDGQIVLFKAPGCDACDHTGYKGRVGLHELLLADATVKRLIQTRATVSEIKAAAVAAGMRSLKQNGIEKVLQGLTDIHQVRAVCG